MIFTARASRDSRDYTRILFDAKTGGFDLTGGLYDRKNENKLTDAETKMLAAKAKRFDAKLSLKEWHTLAVHTKGMNSASSSAAKPSAHSSPSAFRTPPNRSSV